MDLNLDGSAPQSVIPFRSLSVIPTVPGVTPAVCAGVCPPLKRVCSSLTPSAPLDPCAAVPSASCTVGLPGRALDAP